MESKELDRLIKDRAFRIVPLDSIKTDYTYQRPLKRTFRKISDDFNIDAFGIPILGQRQDGSLYVVDGQQRLAAVRELGWEEVRVEVFSSDGQQHEAEIFKLINMNRRKLNAGEEYRSLIAAKDPVALKVRSVCAQNGFEVVEGRKNTARMSKESAYHKLSCIKFLMDVIQNYGETPLNFAFRIMNECWKGQPEASNSVIISGLVQYFVQNKPIQEKKLDKAIANWKKVGPHILYQDAAKLASIKRINAIKCIYEVMLARSIKRL